MATDLGSRLDQGITLPFDWFCDPEIFRLEQRRVFADSWVYDPATDDWEALPPMPTARHGLGAAALNDRIHVFGGGLKTGGNAASDIHEVLVLDEPR